MKYSPIVHFVSNQQRVQLIQLDIVNRQQEYQKEQDKVIIKELLKDIGKTEEDEYTFEEFKLFIIQYIHQNGDDKNYNTSTENCTWLKRRD